MQGMQVHMAPGRLGARRAEGELLIETREQIITKKINKIYFIFISKVFAHMNLK